jgi:hypothetical protein
LGRNPLKKLVGTEVVFTSEEGLVASFEKQLMGYSFTDELGMSGMFREMLSDKGADAALGDVFF